MKKHISNSRHGFTLAELLIVIAIIAVLVAIAIPVFTSLLEKSRETTDIANIRSAYAAVAVDVLSDEATDTVKVVPLTQTKDNWQTDKLEETLEKLGTVSGKPTRGGTCEVSWMSDLNCALFSFTGSRIPFPDPSNRSAFAKAYADLVKKYVDTGVIPEKKYDSKLQEFNGHEIINIGMYDGNFNTLIRDQAELDKYPQAVLDMLNNPGDKQWTAYMDENRNLIGYYFTDKKDPDNPRSVDYGFLYDGQGNLIKSLPPNAMGDQNNKQDLADHYWPQG